jgi:hypothetical protein
MNTLDSVVDALARDPARKFVVVEQVSTVQHLSSILPKLLSYPCRLQVLLLHRRRSSVFSPGLVLVLVVCFADKKFAWILLLACYCYT